MISNLEDQYCPNANGNVMGYVDADGTDVDLHCEFEYSPFGKSIKEVGSNIDDLTFRFSTKYTDVKTDLVYYGYRSYNSELGRFMNKDPLGERGGLNLYAFVSNSPIGWIDNLGHEPVNNCPNDLADDLSPGDVAGNSLFMNCYGYACNDKEELVSGEKEGDDSGFTAKRRSELIAVYKKYGGVDVPKDGCCPKGFHKIHIRMSKSNSDFHIYRQDNEGNWSHSMTDEAGSLVLTVDGSGNPIIDPSTADHNYTEHDEHRPPEGEAVTAEPYSNECGNLCVKTR